MPVRSDAEPGPPRLSAAGAPRRSAVMRLLHAALWALQLMLAAAPVSAAEVAGVQIPNSLSLAGAGPSLVLNGAGVREKWFFDIYVGALYLRQRSQDVQAILAGSGPAAVLMHFLYKEVSREKITEAWETGLAANHSAAEMQVLRPQLDRFNALFVTLRAGEVVEIDYVLGQGTEVRIDGKLRGKVEGDAFFHALLQVWLGEHPVTGALKRAMLGLER